MGYLPGFNAKKKMTKKIIPVKWGWRIIVKHNQVIVAITFKTILMKIVVDIPETTVGFAIINSVEIVTGKKG